MINSIKLRTFVSLSFVIFSLPFLRTCSDKSIESFPKNEVVEIIEIGNNSEIKKHLPSQEQMKKSTEIRNKRILQSKKEFTFNFYELVYKTFGQTDLKLDTLRDKTFYPLLGLLLIFINSFFLVFCSFTTRKKLTYKLAILNFILLIFTTIGLILSEIVENINQFKIGYYLFALNSIIIIFLSRKETEAKRNYS